MKIVNENLANLRTLPFQMFLDEQIIFRSIQMFLDIREFQMYLDIFRYIQIVVLKQAGLETRLHHFSPRSRDQQPPAQGPGVNMIPPASVTAPLSCIECCADKILRVLTHAVWVFRQLVRQAAIGESIPLGARKTPGYQACVYKLCGKGRP